VSWQDWPLEYVLIPAWLREAAPSLYYLSYRSPAPFDSVESVKYEVHPLPPAAEAERRARHLMQTNHATIKLNHVVHHGGLGHHVQNWYAYRSPSRIGRIAAVDCASRIALVCGGTMAEGWACYATDLMDETGFLTPHESVAQQHARVRMLARLVVDLELHSGRMSLEQAVAFYMETAGMTSEAAWVESVKNSMFPGTAAMYWLGTNAIHDLRAREQKRLGPAFSLRAFNDELLSFGSIPVQLTSEFMQ
jgi:uncharacterized protein (DUF885 family)